MDYSADELPGDDDSTIRDVPCRTCRRRKVRCSRTQPCDNCQQACIVCEYDERQSSNSASSRADRVLAQRVSELEALVRRYQEQAKTAGGGTFRGRATPASTFAQSPFAVERILHELGSIGSTQPMPQNLITNGKLVLDGSMSRHVLSTFWASMYEEIEDLKFLLREEKEMSSNTTWLRSREDSNLAPISLILPPAHSEYLVRAYISNVDQSVRVLHKPTLLKKWNLLWRGMLPDFQEFECQLAVVYCLALLSVTPQDCQVHLGQSREVLAERLRAQAEKGLATLSIATTLNLSSLQTFVLYITFLIMTGKTLLASSLLGLAIRTAQRMGVHRDGTHYNLGPWHTETRRRLWHHILLLDTLCMEHHGFESAVPLGFSDTKLPLNANDAAWDVSEFSNQQPSPQSGFTDNSFALVQYETAALVRLGLDRVISFDGSEQGRFPAHHPQLQKSFWDYIDGTYLTHLDASLGQQRLILEVTRLMKRKTALIHARGPTTSGDAYQDFYMQDESRLLADAVDYCKHVQAARAALAPARLDWIIVRAFCWHSLMIMLSTTLRQQALTRSEDAKWALQRLTSLFNDQPTIDYLRENETLWEPIGKLMSELVSRHGEVERQIRQVSLAGVGT